MIIQRQAHQMPSRKILLSVRQIAETREYQRIAASRLADLPTGPMPTVKRQQQFQQRRRYFIRFDTEYQYRLNKVSQDLKEIGQMCQRIIDAIASRQHATAPLPSLPIVQPLPEEVGEQPADAEGEYIRDDAWLDELEVTERLPASRAPRTTRPFPKLPRIAPEETPQASIAVVSHFPPTSKHELDADNICTSLQSAAKTHYQHFTQRVTAFYLSRTYLTFLQALGYEDFYWDDLGYIELRAGHALADEELLCVSETGETHVAQASESSTHI